MRLVSMSTLSDFGKKWTRDLTNLFAHFRWISLKEVQEARDEGLGIFHVFD